MVKEHDATMYVAIICLGVRLICLGERLIIQLSFDQEKKQTLSQPPSPSISFSL